VKRQTKPFGAIGNTFEKACKNRALIKTRRFVWFVRRVKYGMVGLVLKLVDSSNVAWWRQESAFGAAACGSPARLIGFEGSPLGGIAAG
jgi:hypothetical protein